MAFAQQDRARLMAQPGIGPGVISRLQTLGLDSLDKLRAASAEGAVAQVCEQLGTSAWRNRLHALARALAAGAPAAKI